MLSVLAYEAASQIFPDAPTRLAISVDGGRVVELSLELFSLVDEFLDCLDQQEWIGTNDPRRTRFDTFHPVRELAKNQRRPRKACGFFLHSAGIGDHNRRSLDQGDELGVRHRRVEGQAVAIPKP